MEANFSSIMNFPEWDAGLHPYVHNPRRTRESAHFKSEFYLPNKWTAGVKFKLQHTEDFLPPSPHHPDPDPRLLYVAHIDARGFFHRALFAIHHYNVITKVWVFMLHSRYSSLFGETLPLPTHLPDRLVGLRMSALGASVMTGTAPPLFHDADVPTLPHSVRAFRADEPLPSLTKASTAPPEDPPLPCLIPCDMPHRLPPGWSLATIPKPHSHKARVPRQLRRRDGLSLVASPMADPLPAGTVIVSDLCVAVLSQYSADFALNMAIQIPDVDGPSYVSRSSFHAAFSLPLRKVPYVNANCRWRITPAVSQVLSLETTRDVSTTT